MPTYEYQCQLCGHKLEEFQGINDAALTQCPECGKPSLIKLISATGFQLKGNGWYVTDFKNPTSAKKAPIDTPKADKPTTTDTKPADKKTKE